MNANMDRWIEAANDAVGDLHGGCKPGLRDIRVAMTAFLQAAAVDGVKLTHRTPSQGMLNVFYDGSGRDVDDDWSAMHDAAPNYLGDE